MQEILYSANRERKYLFFFFAASTHHHLVHLADLICLVSRISHQTAKTSNNKRKREREGEGKIEQNKSEGGNSHKNSVEYMKYSNIYEKYKQKYKTKQKCRC